MVIILLHFILLQLVARKHDDAGWFVAGKNGCDVFLAEGASAPGDQDGFVVKHCSVSVPFALGRLLLEFLQKIHQFLADGGICHAFEGHAGTGDSGLRCFQEVVEVLCGPGSTC